MSILQGVFKPLYSYVVVVFGNHDDTVAGDAKTCLQTILERDMIEKVRGSVSETQI